MIGTPEQLGSVQRGDVIQNRDGTDKGMVIGFSRCQLEGCLGRRVWTRWPSGKLTKPCAKGLQAVGQNEWRIL